MIDGMAKEFIIGQIAAQGSFLGRDERESGQNVIKWDLYYGITVNVSYDFLAWRTFNKGNKLSKNAQGYPYNAIWSEIEVTDVTMIQYWYGKNSMDSISTWNSYRKIFQFLIKC